MTCEELRDEYDIYALGLDEEPERSEIREHLRRDCPTCVPAARRSLGLVSAMSALAPEVDPPARLRKRVLAAVNPQLLEKNASGRFGWSLVWGTGMVFLAALAILLGVQAKRLSDLRRSDHARLAEALAILSAPDSRDVSFGTTRTLPPRGRVVISGKQGVVLIASNLPPVNEGQAFELWLIPKGGKPIASGMFRAANGTALAVQTGTVPDNLGVVAVTVENEPGATAPTSKPIIAAPFTAAGRVISTTLVHNSAYGTMKHMDALDLREKGGVRAGEPQTSDRRLFMQLVAFGGVASTEKLISQLREEQVPGTLYADINDPRGVALLTWSDDPDFFVCRVRSLLNRGAFANLTQKPEYTMMGRTYALGHEPQLEDWLLDMPRRRVTDPAWPWAVWYPLRRKGEFSALPPEEMGSILSEHGRIGHSFGTAGLAMDVRLACFGMDTHDSDFVIGLIGKELFPLSACVQAMRKTRQTSSFMESMGPFFVGRAIWQQI